MRVRHRKLVGDDRTIAEAYLHAAAESFGRGIGAVGALRPDLVFDGADFVPQFHGVGARGAFFWVALDVVPRPILQRDREDVHDAVVEGFTARAGVHFRRVAGAGADDEMR